MIEIIFITVITLVIFFFPKIGLFFRWKVLQEKTERILIEDALKHLYDCEDKKVDCTLKSLAGALSLSDEKILHLIAQLETMQLVFTKENTFHLTSEGRSYALRIIRIHRLWERYLADSTGVQEIEWHTQAEKREHQLSIEEAERLAKEMGNPIVDPHGDPIPTVSGEIPKKKGMVLTEVKEKETVQIIHIEDEPKTVYAQLIAQGLHPEMQITIIENSPERIRFEANGEECILAPIFANNISVIPIPEEKIQRTFKTLAAISLGEKAKILGIAKSCRGSQRRRLMDFGITPGTIIEAEFQSAGGDPIAYNVRGALVALRKKQAEQIYIEDELKTEERMSDIVSKKRH